MRWSYADLDATPDYVVDDVARWMREIAEADRKREQAAAREAAKQQLRQRRR